jgi:hypothetical protein
MVLAVISLIMGVNGGGNSLSIQHRSPLIIIRLPDFNHYGLTELKKYPITNCEIK